MSRRHRLAAAALLALFAAQVLTAIPRKSPTFDEPAYLSSGYAILDRGDHRLMPMHPPLSKALAALPLLGMGVDARYDTWGWERGAVWVYAWEFLYGGRNDADRLVFAARSGFVALGVLLGLLVHGWARSLYGPGGGLLALFLFAFSPNLLAHAGIATTDLPVTFFILAALFVFDRAARRLSRAGAVGAGVLWGLALLSKHTGWVLLPVLAAVFAIRLWREEAARGWGRRLAFVGLFGLAAYGALWGGYLGCKRSDPAGRPPEALLGFLWDRGLLPEPYLTGLHQTKITMGRPAFLDGEHSRVVTVLRGDPPVPVPRLVGWPHYFVMTFLYKTPLPGLLLFVAALAVSRRLPRGTLAEEVPLWILGGAVFVAVSASGMNIGHRHALPILPAAVILMGRLVPALAGLAPRFRTGAWGAVGALLAWYAAGTLRIHPHHLAYFNEIAGGPQEAPRHLTDSNIDWGQDLKLLARSMRERGIEEVHLSYLGTADPAYYGIRYRALPGYTLNFPPPSAGRRSEGIRAGEYVAVSVTNLMETFEPWPALMGPIREWIPLERVGYSIYLYRAPSDLAVPSVPAGR